jgi:hypothetical protein
MVIHLLAVTTSTSSESLSALIVILSALFDDQSLVGMHLHSAGLNFACSGYEIACVFFAERILCPCAGPNQGPIDFGVGSPLDLAAINLGRIYMDVNIVDGVMLLDDSRILGPR